MYFCTDCGTHVCENHSYFGSDGLEQCARCNIRHERAQAGPPPPPPPGGGGGQGGHLVKVGAEVVVMDMPQLHHQVLGIMVEAKVPLGLLEARVEGLLPGVNVVERPGSMVVLRIFMELGTISVVPVSMVLPTEVALATKGLALAVVSPTMLQVTPQVLQVVVILGQVLVPVGREMVVFYLKP